MRNLYALMGILLLLATTAVAGSFTAEMDVKTYVDASNANQSFADGDLLWVASQGGEPEKLTYLSVINMLGSQGIFKQEQIASATLTLDAVQVDKPGKVKAYFMNGEAFDTTTWYDKADYDSEFFSPSLDVENVGSYSLDVTSIIRKAIETCTEGCGYSIVIVAEDDTSIGFASGRASGNEPILKYETE